MAAETSTLARLQALKLPFAELLGIEFKSAGKDRVVGEIGVRADLCTKPATMHGGAIMAFADALRRLGRSSICPRAPQRLTIESKTNFIGAAPLGTRLTGEALPVHRGRLTQVWTTRVTTAEGRLVAVVTQTQMVLASKT